MLTLITGRIASGKTQQLIDRIGQRIASGQKSVLIVPDHATYNFEQRLCAQLNLNGFIDAEVCSFNRLAANILQYCGGGKKIFLDDCGKAMVMRACIERARPFLTIFKNASLRKGFCQRCLNMISTLENCGYSPADILSTAEKLEASILKYKLTDTALIYQKYIEILDSGYTDNADRLKKAEELLLQYRPLDGCEIFIDGFDVFTSRLYSFISKMMLNGNVTIALSSAPEDADKSAYELHTQTLQKLIALAKENGVAYSITRTKLAQTIKSPEIHFIQDAFYAAKTPSYAGTCQNIHLNFYRTALDEVTDTAKAIALQVRAGARYKDFCVLCNDMAKYSPLVQSVFARYEIPVYTDNKHDIASHPVAMYLFSALKCAQSGFAPEYVMDFVRSGLTPLNRDEADRLAAFIQDMGVKGYELEHGLAYRRGDEARQADFDLLREKTLPPLQNFKQSLQKAASAREKAACCYTFMEEQDVYSRVNALVDEYEALGFFSLSDVTAQLWNISVKLLEDIAGLLQEETLSLSEFTDTLLEGFQASPASTIPNVLDCVTFGDLKAAREQKPRHAFIIGANDGVIPAVYIDDRLVTPEESNILLENGMELAHSATTEDARMRYDIYAAFSAPYISLTVSCPLTAFSGSPLRPSYLFKRFKRLFPGLTETVKEQDSVENTLSNPLTPAQTMLAMALDQVRSPKARAVFDYLAENNEGIRQKFDVLAYERREKQTQISPLLAAKIFSPQKATSISRLETYAKCPYAHFIRYGLNPQQAESYSVTAADIGSVFHSTLEDFTHTLLAEKKEWTRRECYALAGRLFEQHVPNIHFGAMLSTSRQRVLNRQLKTMVCQSAWAVQNQLGAFTPIGEEISFGFGQNAPLQVPTEFGTLTLKGKIDRADKAEANGRVYLRVIDYKSGPHTFRENDLETGEDIQLMMYMNALLARFGEKAAPAGAYFMPISEETAGQEPALSGPTLNTFAKDEKKAVTDEQFAALLNTASNTAQRLSAGILSGKIDVQPLENACRYCPYGTLCGHDCHKKKEEDLHAELD